ncbi:MAG: tetratricopeptide repeat protein [Verrucomicrobia bacterium]|nr:tetratricopeptide repeat protein [Verrucomicrobiota bacterium]MBO7392229.1 tetratricopeptide repeat protein [Verrucomicrobiota bacterium]
MQKDPNSSNSDPSQQPFMEGPSRTYFIEAVGWMELGNYEEALHSVSQIVDKYVVRFEVLALKWSILYKLGRKKECKDTSQFLTLFHSARVDSWMMRAQSFYNQKQYQKAYETLHSVEKQFKNDWRFAYDYACYHSLTKRFDKVEYWIKVASRKGDPKEVDKMFQTDPDFKPYKKYLESGKKDTDHL